MRSAWHAMRVGATVAGMLVPGAIGLPVAAAGSNLLVTPAGAGEAPQPPWRWAGLPRQTKPRTEFGIVALEGQRVLRVVADSSYGLLLHPLGPDGQGRMLSWSWRLDDAPENTDLRHRDTDDTLLKVCAMFEHPTDAVPFVERQLLRMARVRAGEVLPAASVCYVWDRHLKPGTTLDNAFTRRVRQIVLRGPEAPLRQWASERRDVIADFRRLFADEVHGEEPLAAVAVGADTDNTRTHSLGHVRDLVLE